MTGNVVISEADGSYVCRTRQCRKARALWEISWYTECMTSQSQCRTNRRRFNRVQLYDLWAVSSKMMNPLKLTPVQSRPAYLLASENITKMLAIHALQLGLRNITYLFTP